jgi:hypothetical protein
MKKIILLIAISILTSVSYGQTKETVTNSSNINTNLKLQIYYFHLTNRCHTCTSIEAEVRRNLDSLFTNDLNSEVLRFAVLNCEAKENEALARKYDAYGATLAFTVYKDGKELKKIDLSNWAFSKINKPEIFSAEFKQKIEEIIR